MKVSEVEVSVVVRKGGCTGDPPFHSKADCREGETKSDPSATQERFKIPQEHPKSDPKATQKTQKQPKSNPRPSKSDPRGPQE